MMKDYNMNGMKLYNQLFAARLTRGKIKLVPLTSKDARILQLHVNNSIGSLKQHMRWCVNGFGMSRARTMTLESEHEWEKKLKQVKHLAFKIMYMDSFAGCITLNEFNDDKTTCSMEYWITEEMRNKRIAVKAVFLCAREAFAGLRLKNINITVFPENVGSIKVMVRVGGIFHGMGCMPFFGGGKSTAFHDRWFCEFYLTKSALRLSGKGSPAALKRLISLERILKIEKIEINL